MPYSRSSLGRLRHRLRPIHLDSPADPISCSQGIRCALIQWTGGGTDQTKLLESSHRDWLHHLSLLRESADGGVHAHAYASRPRPGLRARGHLYRSEFWDCSRRCNYRLSDLRVLAQETLIILGRLPANSSLTEIDRQEGDVVVLVFASWLLRPLG